MNIIVKNSVRKLLQVFVGLSVCLTAFDCLDLSYDFLSYSSDYFMSGGLSSLGT